MKLDHASPNESPLALNELASSIGRLLEVAQNDFAIWTEDELRDVFEYQLAATLDGDLGLFFDDVAGEVARSGFVTWHVQRPGTGGPRSNAAAGKQRHPGVDRGDSTGDQDGLAVAEPIRFDSIIYPGDHVIVVSPVSATSSVEKLFK